MPRKTQGPLLRAFFLRVSPVLVLLGAVGLLAPWPARWLGTSVWAWPLDMAGHWALLWMPLLWLGLLGLRSWRPRWRLVLALALPLLTLAALPPQLPQAPHAGKPAELRLVSANLHLGQHDPQALREWLTREPVDLLALVELSPEYAAALGDLPGLAHRELRARHDPFGLGLLSRWPLREVREELDAGGIPRLRATVLHPDGAFEFIVLHPMPPLSPQWQQVRDQGFAALQARLPDALLAGDLNATPWSSGGARLAEGGWRWASLWRPTWPAAGQGLLGIPIDAVWGRGNWCRSAAGLGPQLGSDHRPVWVDLRRDCAAATKD